jgi:hypothetical protein
VPICRGPCGLRRRAHQTVGPSKASVHAAEMRVSSAMRPDSHNKVHVGAVGGHRIGRRSRRAGMKHVAVRMIKRIRAGLRDRGLGKSCRCRRRRQNQHSGQYLQISHLLSPSIRPVTRSGLFETMISRCALTGLRPERFQSQCRDCSLSGTFPLSCGNASNENDGIAQNKSGSALAD